MVTTPSELDGPGLARLEAQLAAHMPGFEGPLRAERLSGGQSNPTYVLHTPGRRYIMRCKPAPAAKLLPSAHAIEREFRVQAALAGAGFPVARMHYLCTDEALIGRAFYVMEHVEGRILFDQSLPQCTRAERAAMYEEMNRVIAALHGLDFAALGLADFGKPGNYFARQIDRWTRQYRASQTEHIEAMERLIEWLPAHIPPEAQPPVAIVHGDFRLDNLIFHASEPRILAVIDWELSTLGHPLADFAYHAMSWHIRGNAFRGVAGLDLAALGIPDEESYWARYLARTGFTLSGDRRYYLAYNLFRIAGILQGIVRRARDGIAASTQAEDVGNRARAMAELGWDMVRQMGARQIGAQGDSMTARYEVKDGIAVITLDNPPVNGLGWGTRRGAVEALDRAAADPAVRAVVLTGAGRSFCAGADIREFNTPKSYQAPSLHDLLNVVESSPKPVVAAINVLALGGGLELALAAHYRVASPDTQVGLPEVKIGILPGAGGTQRLPRAVGLETALNMIVSGTPARARDLAGTRLFDRIIEGELMEGALAFAREVAGREGPHPRLRDLKVEHPNADGFLEFSRGAVAAVAKHFPAPLRCIDAVAAAVSKPFEEGLREEHEHFISLVETSESKSLRHAFFAERAAAKIPDVGPEVKPRTVKRVAVIGAGTMGSGIAMAFLNAGFPVTLLEAGQEALERGVKGIHGTYEGSVRKGRLKSEQAQERAARLTPTLDYAQLAEADLVIEAVFEDYAVKETVFRRIDAAARAGAILATNTSTLDVNRIAAITQRPQEVLGMHFFSPAHIMRLLEVVRGAKTAPDVLATVMALAPKIGKVAVISGVCDGFIGNRMVEQYVRQALFLLDEGATPEQVDKAVEKFGFAMGPFRMSDLAGNDIGWAIRKRRAVEHPELSYSKVADQLCERGRFGQKTGAGWYDYKPGDRNAYPSAVVNEMVREYARGLGMAPRRIPSEEIVGRLVYALVNEGARILEEGIAARASDIDIVYLNGYGFPLFRGGPMFYADTVGLYNVLRDMRRFAQGYHGEAWKPAALIERLAEEGGRFNGSAS